MWKHSVELWSLASCRLLHRSHPVHLPIGQPGHKHVMWHNTYWRNVIMVCSIRDAHILNTLDLGDWGETSISQAKYNKNKSGILQNIIKFAIWPLSPVSESQKLQPFDALAHESCSPDLNKCHIVMISVWCTKRSFPQTVNHVAIASTVWWDLSFHSDITRWWKAFGCVGVNNLFKMIKLWYF